MDSSSGLSTLQTELLQAFFARNQDFVLTGGGALVGFHLRHRTSHDLDLFASPTANIEAAQRALEDAADAIAARCSSETSYRHFRRFLVTRGSETTLVDLVLDQAPRVDPEVLVLNNIRVDTTREIAANKVCTLVGRCEIRDLVDLAMLLRSGITLEQALADAERKDGAVNAATLAWLLSELSIPAEAVVPGPYTALELDAIRQELMDKLRRLAFPK